MEVSSADFGLVINLNVAHSRKLEDFIPSMELSARIKQYIDSSGLGNTFRIEDVNLGQKFFFDSL